MPRQRQSSDADQGIRVVGCCCERTLERAIGARVVRGITGFACPLQVRQAKPRQRLLIVGLHAQPFLQLSDLSVG